MKEPRVPRLEERKLKDLRPFPRQKDYFNDLPDEELAGLAAAMKTGTVPPIEILPRNRIGLPINTIIRGHQRLRAAQKNGDQEISVLVRYDLANADSATVEHEFLADNHYRRHESPLSRARVALRLLELKPKEMLAGVGDAEMRDRIGKVVGMSGRNLDRHVNVLRAPRAIQDAFEAKKLSLVLASRVGCMPARKQAEVARRLGQGEDPTLVVREMLGPPRKQPTSPRAAIGALADAIEQGETALLSQIDTVGVGDVRRRESTLRRGKVLIGRLLAIVDNWNCAALQEEE